MVGRHREITGNHDALTLYFSVALLAACASQPAPPPPVASPVISEKDSQSLAEMALATCERKFGVERPRLLRAPSTLGKRCLARPRDRTAERSHAVQTDWAGIGAKSDAILALDSCRARGDGTEHWLGDGFHRYFGHKHAGRESILADIRQGTRRDAILFACGANSEHGLRRTNADKRKAVTLLLQDEEWSARKIAERCAVSPGFVDEVKRSLPTVGSDKVTFTNKHGGTSTMATKPSEKAKRAKTGKQQRKEEATQNEKDAYEGADVAADLKALERINEELAAKVKALTTDDTKVELERINDLLPLPVDKCMLKRGEQA